ncbi:ABC transporter ATP-binding protein [Spirillospora sp. NBC_01491]|uniref:ABC transporter ATP-binding protein n=1 Tax=Spirillospora sp. NBC_01491 TaxID=2976007 RepID=UPI003FA6D3C2
MLKKKTPPTSSSPGRGLARAASDDEVVSLTDVRKSYGKDGAARIAALDGVSLSFRAGTFTAIMGPSGSGKSTLLQCAAGLDRVDAGRILLAGEPLHRLPERALTRLRRERMGFVFQSFNLIPALTARQNVELPLRLAGRGIDPVAVDRGLAQVGLADRGRHRPAELSGGQQQRVAIARALVTGPQVLFADEPTGALDSRTARDVLTLLRGVVEEYGHTVVMVTHDPVAASYARRVVFLADGRVTGELADPTAESVALRMAALEPDGNETVPC